MHDTYENSLQYINEQEATNISYVKLGQGNRKLIISFAPSGHVSKDYFFRKSSLVKLKYHRNDFDLLYLRNIKQWYLGGLTGIGENINHTIAFLKKECMIYDKVICHGNSAGGFASLLFGSLLKVNHIVTVDPQTDLEYCLCGWSKKHLERVIEEHPGTWSKYNKLSNIFNDNTSYNICYTGNKSIIDQIDQGRVTKHSLILHGDYHYDQIKHFPNLNKFESSEDVIPLIEKSLDLYT
jgi:hypothetical protein